MWANITVLYAAKLACKLRLTGCSNIVQDSNSEFHNIFTAYFSTNPWFREYNKL